MRGEHPTLPLIFLARMGSSPHARGALTLLHGTGLGKRIIPACAGSTAVFEVQLHHNGDHPRMRGEHVDLIGHTDLGLGSSPHARGARTNDEVHFQLKRIIPACAGSTHPSSRHRARKEDHPRMRGEHNSPAKTSTCRTGSSPHARGAQDAAAIAGMASGIIPACAGSTVAFRPCDGQGRDHPRMRGEHAPTRQCWSCAVGSSPHARGAR